MKNLMLGDEVRDIQAGIAAGSHPIGISLGINSVEELTMAGAENVYSNIMDLTKFIQAF